MRRLIRFLAAFFTVTLIAPVGVAGTVLAAFLFLPLPASLPEPQPTLASQYSRIYDIDGNEIGLFREFDQQIPVEPGDIPQVLKDAVIAAEDRTFYSHGGVDVRGTLRALWADIQGGEITQGGSTITQQYVRNAFEEIGNERSIARKVREAILASQISRQVDKDEILFRYLETTYFGNGAYGVGAASETYFRKPVNQLHPSEAALLAGLIPAPSRYEPRGNPELAESKRQLVLDAMFSESKIDKEEYDHLSSMKIHLASSGPAPEGPHTLVYGPLQQETQYPYFVDYLRRYLVDKYGEDQVFRGGLQIYTTLDPRMQAAATETVANTLAGTEPPLEMALAAVEPPTGFVKAIVGGRDFNTSQVNLALGQLGGGSGRQPGSSFKTFVLAKALEDGIPPDKRYSGASPYHYPNCTAAKGCTVSNYGGSSYGVIDLTTATRKSVNTVYVQLIQDVGVQDTMELARRLGITSSVYDPSVHGPSIALGALDTNPLDMASAYGVFAARGLRAEPVPVVRVLDGEGNILEDHASPDPQRVLEEIVADNVTDILTGVLQPGGTAGDNGIGRPAAGKTGTAQENRDAWFVGYTPVLSTAVWMGYSDAPRPLRGIKGVRAVTGGSIPAATWETFMKKALVNVPITNFNEPAPIKPVADQLRLRERGGYDLGPQSRPAPAPVGGPYVVTVPPPAVEPPPATTTSTSTSTTTTTTPSTTTTTECKGLFCP